MNTLSAEELCDLGEGHLAKEQWDEAQNFFRQALSVDSKLKRALLGQAVVLRLGYYDYTQAQRLLNRCLYHHPRDPEVLTEQGRLHADQGDHPKALLFFEQAISHDPTKREALEGKIRSLLAQGRTADAHQLIESIAPSASHLASHRPWLLRELAQIYVAEGAYDAAVEAFLDAGEPEALYSALAEQGDKAAKDSLAGAIVARQSDNPRALSAVAEAHRSWYDVDAAIEAYTQVVKVTPKDENANRELIDLLRTQERFDDAEVAYQNAVRSLGHASESLLIARARVLFDSNKRDQGIEALSQVSGQHELFSVLDKVRDEDATGTFEALIERQPASTVLLNKAASRMARAGNARRALELLDRVLEVDPKDITAVVAKGEILLEQGRHEDLDSLLKRGYSTFGAGKPELLSLTSRLLIAREGYAEAVRAAVDAGRETDIQDHVSHLWTAGHLAKAEKLVNAALAEYPNSIPFLKAQGELLLQQRSYDAAAKVWKAIREKQPGNIEALLKETFALRSARKFSGVTQLLEYAMRRASVGDHPRLILEFGFLHYDQGKYEEAVQAFDAALAADSNYGIAHLWKVRTLRVAGNRDKAEAAIKQALGATQPFESAAAEITCEMGKLQEAREDWSAAVASYTEALVADGRLVEPYFLKAKALLQLNRNDDAERLIETILEERGSENEVKELAGWFYLKKKDFRKAEAQFDEILSRSPTNFAAINGLGGLYFEQGKFDLAEREFRRALKIDQTDSALQNNLAWALVRQTIATAESPEPLLAEAESYCRKAIELSPTDASSHSCLGIIAFKRGKLLECEDLLERAIDLDPTQSNYSDLGALYAHLGRYEDAQKVLEKAREGDRYDAVSRVELGNVYLQLGRPRDAITALKEACAIDPQANEAVRVLSIALSKQGDPVEALRVLRRAIRSQDQSSVPSLRVTLCRILTELADKTDDPELYAEALKEVRLAIAVQPNNADAYFHAGVVCFRQHDYRGAAKHFKQCYELDQNNFDAEQNLRKLQKLNCKNLAASASACG